MLHALREAGAPGACAPVSWCGGKAEPYEGTWECSDREAQRALVIAWTVCHGHVCRTDREAHWRRLDSKLRLRYGFALEAEVGDVPC